MGAKTAHPGFRRLAAKESSRLWRLWGKPASVIGEGRMTLLVSEAFWGKVEELVPARERGVERPYKRRAGAGRKTLDPKIVFSGIVYVLRTGTPWKALPRELFGSPSSIHKYFREWEEAGFFTLLWERGLAEHHDMAGIAWAWRHDDGGTPYGGADGKQRRVTADRNRVWGPVAQRRRRRISLRM